MSFTCPGLLLYSTIFSACVVAPCLSRAPRLSACLHAAVRVTASNTLGTRALALCQPCAPGTFSATPAAANASMCAPCAPPGGSDAGAVECWPGLVSATASNPPPLVPGFSVGDVVTLVFSEATDAPLPPGL